MKRKNSKKHDVTMYLQEEFFNVIVQVITDIIKADESGTYAKPAEQLKKKLLEHSRTFVDKNVNNVGMYLYENEADLLIRFMSIYISTNIKLDKNYFLEIKKK